jgi:hypothetical protein
LSSVERAALAVGLEALDEPPPELLALAEALGEIDGDVLCHDALS